MSKLTSQGQKEKDELDTLEKRYQDEKRQRQSLEGQLAQEKKYRESQDMQIADLKKSMSSIDSTIKAQKQAGGCKMEQCSKRIREVEIENEKMSEEMRKKQDRVLMLECELKSLNRTRDTESRVDTLMVALNLMEDKNTSLQESLSAETRFKLDLFSALGEARRQLESANCKSWAILLRAVATSARSSVSSAPSREKFMFIYIWICLWCLFYLNMSFLLKVIEILRGNLTKTLSLTLTSVAFDRKFRSR